MTRNVLSGDIQEPTDGHVVGELPPPGAVRRSRIGGGGAVNLWPLLPTEGRLVWRGRWVAVLKVLFVA